MDRKSSRDLSRASLLSFQHRRLQRRALSPDAHHTKLSPTTTTTIIPVTRLTHEELTALRRTIQNAVHKEHIRSGEVTSVTTVGASGGGLSVATYAMLRSILHDLGIDKSEFSVQYDLRRLEEMDGMYVDETEEQRARRREREEAVGAVIPYNTIVRLLEMYKREDAQGQANETARDSRETFRWLLSEVQESNPPPPFDSSSSKKFVPLSAVCQLMTSYALPEGFVTRSVQRLKHSGVWRQEGDGSSSEDDDDDDYDVGQNNARRSMSLWSTGGASDTPLWFLCEHPRHCRTKINLRRFLLLIHGISKINTKEEQPTSFVESLSRQSSTRNEETARRQTVTPSVAAEGGGLAGLVVSEELQNSVVSPLMIGSFASSSSPFVAAVNNNKNSGGASPTSTENENNGGRFSPPSIFTALSSPTTSLYSISPNGGSRGSRRRRRRNDPRIDAALMSHWSRVESCMSHIAPTTRRNVIDKTGHPLGHSDSELLGLSPGTSFSNPNNNFLLHQAPLVRSHTSIRVKLQQRDTQSGRSPRVFHADGEAAVMTEEGGRARMILSAALHGGPPQCVLRRQEQQRRFVSAAEARYTTLKAQHMASMPHVPISHPPSEIKHKFKATQSFSFARTRRGPDEDATRVLSWREFDACQTFRTEQEAARRRRRPEDLDAVLHEDEALAERFVRSIADVASKGVLANVRQLAEPRAMRREDRARAVSALGPRERIESRRRKEQVQNKHMEKIRKENKERAPFRTLMYYKSGNVIN
eukprot:PhM_4_TR3810/c0_g1_i1/m.92001